MRFSISVSATERTYRDVGYLAAFGEQSGISQQLPNKRNL